MPLIKIKDLSYKVSDKTILSDINFEILSGDIVTLIGPNGAGKSTLLKIISGILSPSKGKVIYSKQSSKGYVPQNFFVDSMLPITVLDFLKFTKSDIEEVVDYIKIEKILNRQLSDLSGGETKKVLLAKALIKKPEVLFLDEPVGGLDIDAEASFYEIILRTRKVYNCTIIMVSHDLHMVMASSNKVVCLNKSIYCQGSPSEIATSSGYLKLFGHKSYIYQPNIMKED